MKKYKYCITILNDENISLVGVAETKNEAIKLLKKIKKEYKKLYNVDILNMHICSNKKAVDEFLNKNYYISADFLRR